MTRLIDAVESARRADAVDIGRSSVRLEGFILPPEVDEIDRRFISGEIDKPAHTAEYLRLARELA